jgi:hypothetical protein
MESNKENLNPQKELILDLPNFEKEFNITNDVITSTKKHALLVDLIEKEQKEPKKRIVYTTDPKDKDFLHQKVFLEEYSYGLNSRRTSDTAILSGFYRCCLYTTKNSPLKCKARLIVWKDLNLENPVESVVKKGSHVCTKAEHQALITKSSNEIWEGKGVIDVTEEIKGMCEILAITKCSLPAIILAKEILLTVEQKHAGTHLYFLFFY